jgi:repressor LexA
MAKELTARQRQVFEFILRALREENRPPTVREIAAHFGFRSPKAVTDHLSAMERKGYIVRRNRKSRNIEVAEALLPKGVPIVGRIAAGSPILALENLQGSLSINTLVRPTEKTFALRVQGESMRNVGILDGDFVVVEGGASVRNGMIAAVRLGEEATVKRVFFEKDKVRLKPENPAFEEITVDKSSPDVEVCGPVRAVIRAL